MNLQIDAGNTRLKWRVRHQGRTLVQGVEGGRGHGNFAGARHYAIKRVLISAVISEEARCGLSARVSELFGCVAEFYSATQAERGVRSRYERPESLGVDRWHAMIAARSLSTEGQVIVDAGSALTVDFLSATGEHLGGYILPGRKLMLDSLQLKTAKVTFEHGLHNETAPGASTQEAVLSGLNWLCAALGDRVKVDADDMGLSRILLTGGDASHLMTLGFPGVYYPDLVLDGLEIAARADAGQ